MANGEHTIKTDKTEFIFERMASIQQASWMLIKL